MELYHLHYSTEWSYHVLVIPLDGKQGCFYFFSYSKPYRAEKSTLLSLKVHVWPVPWNIQDYELIAH